MPVHDTDTLRAMVAEAMQAAGADAPTVAACLDIAERGNSREFGELLVWCSGRALTDARVLRPLRDADAHATRVGTLVRGQWRGVPQLPPGATVGTPHVSGHLWRVLEALRAGDAARAKRRRTGSRAESRRKRDHARGTCDGHARALRAASCRVASGLAEYGTLRAAFRARWGF